VKPVELPDAALRSSAIQIMGSGLKSAPFPKLLETIWGRQIAAPLSATARLLTAKMASSIPAPVLMTMTEELDISISTERMMAMLAIFFAGCALFVTAIGLYGTLAYATARRTSEIGISMAMGAQRGRVVGMVFRENALIAASGSVAGLLIALLASQALASFLYGT
jgi:ABC-type antimicrobial peptide transport system permease subunit